MSDEYYDEDGFRLTFEDDTSEQEKQFFMRAFPNVNRISERKVHCTSCYMHIGTAPISEAVIRMHPILRVTHCRNCHTFYNSGEFDKGEDGSELYCRWCGQGGEVYCCSKCPYVFCKKCIVQNLSRACVQDISRNDNWQCFSCAPKIMWHLRAQHWALVNYIEKQKKDMKDKNHTVQSINNLMKQDNTTCCNNKGLNKKSSTPASAKKGVKRASDAHESGAAKIPEKRTMMQVQQQQQSPVLQPPVAKKVKTDNNEVVCTPDIMSMFMNPEESNNAAGARPAQPAQKPAPAPPAPVSVPMSQRQVVVRPAFQGAQNPVPMRMPIANASNLVPPPVYHTINGYKIDLHTAAQQGTYRLPNGKLIQVRKQAPAAPSPQQAVANRNVTIAPKPPTTYYNPPNVVPNQPARVINGNPNVHINLALQQQQQLQEQRLQQQRQQQQQQQQYQQQQQQLLQQVRPPLMVQVGQPQPTIVAGQPNPALQLPTLVMLQSMVNGPHEDSPLGRSRKNFEGKLLSGVEICQHIVSKINTLTNSNPFKNIRNVRDLKELYIHVSYLLTYAIGRFKTLQEKCVDDVKKMGFTKESDFVMMGEQISNRNPDEDKSDDEGDCEIVEQNTTLITIDSEDEEEGGKKHKDSSPNKRQPAATETEVAVAAILEDKNDADMSGDPIPMDDFLHVSLSEGDKSLEPTSSTVSIATDASDKTDKADANNKDGSSNDKAENDEDDVVEIIDEAATEDVLPEKQTDNNAETVADETTAATVENVTDKSAKSQEEATEKLAVDEVNKESSKKLEDKANDETVNNKVETDKPVEAEKEAKEKEGEPEKMEVEQSGDISTGISEQNVVESTEEKVENEKQVEENKSSDVSNNANDDSEAKAGNTDQEKADDKADDGEKMETNDVETSKQSIDDVTKEETAKPSETNDPIELDDDEDDDVTVVEPVDENEVDPLNSSIDPLNDVDNTQVNECSVESVAEGDSSEKSTSPGKPTDSTVAVAESSKEDVAEGSDPTASDVEMSGETCTSSKATEEVAGTAGVSESLETDEPMTVIEIAKSAEAEDVTDASQVSESNSKAVDEVDEVQAPVSEPSEIDEPPTVIEVAENSEPTDATDASQVSESNIKTVDEVQELTKSVHESDDHSSVSNALDIEKQSAESAVSDAPAVSETLPEELEAPTGNDLLASIEDSFQKLQQLFDATENDADVEQPPQANDADVDMNPTEPAPAEQMEVDESPSVGELENGLLEAAQKTLDKNFDRTTADTNLLGLEDGLELITSDENFTNSQKSLNSPQNSTTSLAEKSVPSDKLEEVQNCTSLDELPVNGDC
ncbi:uncharacterized protein LOC128738782 [Sabethes cyaneus]|uniref:uncharacterized protein LOC128738782 n=1 Tax=Sabethes cyaneus TaxID=53552 RepID=UPI00237E0F47|nr:uncharacterized protein LOC128738782 [Sabethes cyaneus]